MLKNFGVGGDFDMVLGDQENPYRYNLMWMEDLPSPIENGLESFNFRVSFLGQVTELEHREEDLISTNRNEVISDMRSIAIDFLSYWKQLRSDNTVRFSILTNITVLEDVTPDKLYGVQIDISFKVLQAFNKCIIPMSGIDPPESQDVSIYGNDTLMVTVAPGNNYEFEIKNVSGDLVGSWNPVTKVWTVPDVGSGDPVTMTFNTDPITSTPAGQEKAVTAVNSIDEPVGVVSIDTANALEIDINDSNIGFNGVAQDSLPAQNDKEFSVYDSQGNLIGSVAGQSANTLDIVVDDATQTMNGAEISAQLPETAKTFVIRYANNDPVVVTPITDTETVFVGEVPDVVTQFPSSKIWKTGQTTAYGASGKDDGSLERGNGASFTTLNKNNYFGNTNRFTDILGGQTYTNNWVIDWSTWDKETGEFVMWYRVKQSIAAWETIMTNQPYTIGSYNDCYVPHRRELPSLINSELIDGMNYSPINISVSGGGTDQLYTSTTVPSNTAAAYAWFGQASNGAVGGKSKVSNGAYILLRVGSVSEL
jgi:hypothetical protein